MRPEFEYDEEKSRSNLVKHGIDFEAAQELWRDDSLYEVPAHSSDELRVIVVGKIRGRHWTAIVTYRSERIRLISVRRAREEEVSLYEG
jgi:uncharacterized DUF497 family protein